MKRSVSVLLPHLLCITIILAVFSSMFLCALIISISNRVLNTPAITILLVCDKHFFLYMQRIYASTRGQRPPLLTLPPPNNLMIKLLATN